MKIEKAWLRFWALESQHYNLKFYLYLTHFLHMFSVLVYGHKENWSLGHELKKKKMRNAANINLKKLLNLISPCQPLLLCPLVCHTGLTGQSESHATGLSPHCAPAGDRRSVRRSSRVTAQAIGRCQRCLAVLGRTAADARGPRRPRVHDLALHRDRPLGLGVMLLLASGLGTVRALVGLEGGLFRLWRQGLLMLL